MPIFGMTHSQIEMLANLLQSEQRVDDPADQLLKLYWNRAGVKRELSSLRRERFELLDKLKEQESAISRAQEQLEGLERLLTNPLAAANAMVYFQLRHMWRTAALRVEQFAKELEIQRDRRERAQLHESALAKRKRRLDAINEKLGELAQKRKEVIDEQNRLEQRLANMNLLMKLLRGRKARKQIQGINAGRVALEDRIQECNQLVEGIQGEPLPELEGLSLESRRLINVAIIALAQHLLAHFAEHDLASLAKTSTQRPVADMKFGDRSLCDRMVERIRERVEELRTSKSVADQVRKRTDILIGEMKYRNDTDSVPRPDCVEEITMSFGADPGNSLMRRATDAPLRINVLDENYWDIFAVLR
jgi:predicted nuclease with TOPRIM domain